MMLPDIGVTLQESLCRTRSYDLRLDRLCLVCNVSQRLSLRDPAGRDNLPSHAPWGFLCAHRTGGHRN